MELRVTVWHCTALTANEDALQLQLQMCAREGRATNLDANKTHFNRNTCRRHRLHENVNLNLAIRFEELTWLDEWQGNLSFI